MIAGASKARSCLSGVSDPGRPLAGSHSLREYVYVWVPGPVVIPVVRWRAPPTPAMALPAPHHWWEMQPVYPPLLPCAPPHPLHLGVLLPRQTGQGAFALNGALVHTPTSPAPPTTGTALDTLEHWPPTLVHTRGVAKSFCAIRCARVWALSMCLYRYAVTVAQPSSGIPLLCRAKQRQEPLVIIVVVKRVWLSPVFGRSKRRKLY